MNKSKRAVMAVIPGFFALTIAIYGQSLNNKFVRWDDGLLIYENPIVRDVSTRSIAEAFSSYDPELYIPLTLISYQIDYRIGGTGSFMYHFVNLLLHTINALLVTFFIFLLSKRKWVALFCGLLFAAHPLNTEAVAWASARKDVLATFFFLLAVVSYVKNLESRGGGSRLRVYIFFILSLLAKVSTVTLPIILLLVDYYKGRRLKKQVFMEKIPYFAISTIFGIIAIFGKAGVSKNMTFLQALLLSARSTVFYVYKLFVPTNLSVLYPAIGDISIMRFEYAVPVLIIVMIAATLVLLRRNKTFVFSVLFFLITLAPAFATFAKGGDVYFASDRYAYIPSIGLLFLVCYFVFLVSRRKFSISFVALSAVVGVFAFMARVQSKVWADTETLFQNVVENYSSYRAHNNIGNVYRRKGDLDGAVREFETALSIKPNAKTLGNLGAVYRKKGMIKEALGEYRKAISAYPDDPEPYFGLGLVYAQSGDAKQARENYLKAIELDPGYAEAYLNMGALYAAQDRYQKAVEQYLKAIESDSLFVQAYYNLGIAYAKAGYVDKAEQAYEGAVELAPDFTAARLNLGILYYGNNRVDDAVRQFKAVLKINPGNQTAASALRQIIGE